MHQRSQNTAQPNTAGSWIDIASQPSSSSLSSAAEDIITTDLRVESLNKSQPKSRTGPSSDTRSDSIDRQPSTGESSQDEYDESESEPDQVLTYSNEVIQPFSSPNETISVNQINLDSTQQCFTPHPNAFSHPPSATFQSRDAITNPCFPASCVPRPKGHIQAPSPHIKTRFLSDRISPAFQADQDAALRASLNTLLSCAAAARGLPKNVQDQPISFHQSKPNCIRPSSLRIVPEAIVFGNRTSDGHCRSSRSSSRTCATEGSERCARKIAQSPSKDSTPIRKLQKPDLREIPAPTSLTWIVSAGVLVLVSAISFSFGFVTGREAGRLGSELVQDSEADAIKYLGQATAKYELGFRRLRWSGPASVAHV